MPVASPENLCVPYWFLASAFASGGGTIGTVIGVLWARNNRLTDNTERRLDQILDKLTEKDNADESKSMGV